MWKVAAIHILKCYQSKSKGHGPTSSSISQSSSGYTKRSTVRAQAQHKSSDGCALKVFSLFPQSHLLAETSDAVIWSMF